MPKLGVLDNMPKLGILDKPLIARKLSKSDDGRYRPKHVVFHC